MALTNDQITAQNFKDFYGQIRPYLNGQVPTFANQFSRSDLYSTSEKIIGCWTDGKPLYQKTISLSNLPKGQTTVLHGISNLGAVEKIYGAMKRSDDNYYICVPFLYGTFSSCIYIFDVSQTSFQIAIGDDFNNLFNYANCGTVTIQYTKTTDSAIKVGTGTDYSTEEQIIGTWIDGKPLYQKTFETTTPANNTDTLIVELPSNCIARSFDGYILQDGYNRMPLNAYYSSAEFVCTYMQFNPDNGIRMKCESAQWRSCTAVITVLYTKTTD